MNGVFFHTSVTMSAGRPASSQAVRFCTAPGSNWPAAPAAQIWSIVFMGKRDCAPGVGPEQGNQ